MTDIDWLAVDMAISGVRLKLRPDEKRAVVRHFANRMRQLNECSISSQKLTSADLAERLGTTERSIERYKAELAGGTEGPCPVCRNQMWTVRGTVLPHADSLFVECPMSAQEHGPRGLAAERPDLYRWLDEEISA